MQMGHLEGMHNAVYQSGYCPQEFYFADECPLFLVSYHEKAALEKANSFMEEFPTIRKVHSSFCDRTKRLLYYKVWLSENNSSDCKVKHFVLDNIPPPAYAPNLGGPPLPMVILPHSFFIWDRLGLAGRRNNPSKQHYNPLIPEWFRQSKIQVVLLPPKGHEANLTELFQATVQENVRKWHAPWRRDQTFGPANF